MALANYEDLKAAVGAWSFNRTDLPAADLVRLGEARLNRDLRLRVMEAEAALAAAAGDVRLPLPAGFLAPIALWRSGAEGRAPLRRVLSTLAVSTAAGTPEYWTLDADAVAFERPCAAATDFVLRYLAAFELSEAEPENWLLANHPDAYLAAALVEAALWAADEDQAVRWQARYEAAVGAVNRREAISREAPLRTELALERRFGIVEG